MAAGTPGIINWQISPVGTATVKPASDPVMLPVAVSDSWPTITVNSGYEVKNYSLNGKTYTEAELKALTLSESNATDYSVSTGEYLFTVIINVVSTSEKKYVSNEGLDYFYSKLKRKIPTQTAVAYTVVASGWTDGVYSLENAYPVATYDLEIALNGDSITSDQITAWNKAQIIGSATANKLIAKGTVPTVDIPVTMLVRSK